jgi:hypothetical protein
MAVFYSSRTLIGTSGTFQPKETFIFGFGYEMTHGQFSASQPLWLGKPSYTSFEVLRY